MRKEFFNLKEVWKGMRELRGEVDGKKWMFYHFWEMDAPGGSEVA